MQCSLFDSYSSDSIFCPPVQTLLDVGPGFCSSRQVPELQHGDGVAVEHLDHLLQSGHQVIWQHVIRDVMKVMCHHHRAMSVLLTCSTEQEVAGVGLRVSQVHLLRSSA